VYKILLIYLGKRISRIKQAKQIMNCLSCSTPLHNNLALFRFIIILIVVSCKLTNAIVKLPPNVSVPAVLVFGDSIVDTGNNNNNLRTTARCNFPPYGKDFKGGIPTGRFSNGKVPSDLLGTYYY
jgi:hypothetical protein